MKFNILNAGESRPQTTIKGLIYGQSGAGKSYLGATAPKPLILLTELNGQMSISHSNPKADIIHVTDVRVLVEVLRDIDENPKAWSKYDTIVIDSITEMQRLIKDSILGKRTQMEIQDWSKLTSNFRRLIRRIRNLNKSVICIGLVESENEESTGVRHVRPAFEGKKTGPEIAQYFNFVGLLFTQQDTDGDNVITIRNLMLDGPDRIMCKTIAPLTGTIRDPNIARMFKEIQKK